MNKGLWLSHSILLRETIFDGYVVNTEPLRIGSGREAPLEAMADLAVLRIRYWGAELPYIPGSSLKGTFRSYATSLARYFGLSVCSGLSKDTCCDVKIDNNKKLSDWIEDLTKTGKSEEAIMAFYENACLMCKVFGSTCYKSNVCFSDAYPIDENGRIIDVKTGVRTGIAIDRRTGSAHPSAFYKVEFVEPGARFKFTIYCRNLPNYAIGMLSLILKRMNDGLIKIGGFKSRGFGTVKVEKLKFKNRDFTKSANLMMCSLEPGVDFDVDLSEVAELKDGWIATEGANAWKALDKFIEVWNKFAKKG